MFYRIEEYEQEEQNENTLTLSEPIIIDNEALKQCVEALRGTQYLITGGKLWYKNKNKLVPISNFISYPEEKVTLENGQDKEVFYKVRCISLENPELQLTPLNITVEQLQKSNYILGSEWDRIAILNSGSSNTDRFREVTQLISRKTMQEKHIYTNTGFEKINDKLVYLFHGGAIGNDTDDIVSDLSRDGLERYCFTDKDFEEKQALSQSLSFLDVANYSITIPILALVYLSPLYSLLAENNINADFVLFIQGKSGTRKSSLSAVALSHFGNFTRDTFPSSFRDTLNSIEKKAFVLKDGIIVVDDFNPEALDNSKLNIVDKIMGMFGDRIGRTRMSNTGATLKRAYIARGMCIITGETIPDVGQSRIARTIIITMKQDSINLNKLSELQENKAELAFAMKTYIQYIIDNEDDILTFAKAKFKEMQQNQQKGVHGRTTEAINILIIAFKIFTMFLVAKGVINSAKKSELDQACIKTLIELTKEQAEQVTDLKPTDIFYNDLGQLFATQKIKVLNYKDKSEFLNNSFGEIVGYYNQKDNTYYFFPEPIYQKIKLFHEMTGTKFPINERTIWKYLAEEGYLVKSNDGRYRKTITVGGQKQTIVEIRLREDSFVPRNEETINGTTYYYANRF